MAKHPDHHEIVVFPPVEVHSCGTTAVDLYAYVLCYCGIVWKAVGDKWVQLEKSDDDRD